MFSGTKRALSTFTIALEIAALVAAADWLEGEERDAALDMADERNERVEEWCAVVDTKDGPEGKRRYVRIAPAADKGDLEGCVPLANRGDAYSLPAAEMVGLDYSYLVRLALRQPDDPVVVESLAFRSRSSDRGAQVVQFALCRRRGDRRDRDDG